MTSVDVELGLTAVAAMLSPTTLTFCVLALVLSKRPGRTGLWFLSGRGDRHGAMDCHRSGRRRDGR